MLPTNTWAKRALILALVTTLVVSPGAVADDREADDEQPEPVGRPNDTTTPGWVIAPSHVTSRLFSPVWTNGVTHFYLPVTAGADFSIDSTDALRMNTCTLGLCVSTGDFDIVFFKENVDGSSTVTGRFATVGPEEGEVPESSDYALAYLTTPGTSPSARGFGFLYHEVTHGNGKPGK